MSSDVNTECSDTADCECRECLNGKIVNLRLALIKCVILGTVWPGVRQEAIDTITLSYGSDRWLDLHGIRQERRDDE